MDIKRIGSQRSTKGQGEYFTETVRIDPLFQASDPARAVGASVTFEPGSRTAWHPSARSNADRDYRLRFSAALRCDGPIEEIHPGDMVWFQPGEKYWYDSYCHSGTARWQDGRLDGEGQ
jgi:quercetin dioxygenase-like cupin family protein